MSTLAKNVSQVVLYENQVSDFVALLWMQAPLGSRATLEIATCHTGHIDLQRLLVILYHIIITTAVTYVKEVWLL